MNKTQPIKGIEEIESDNRLSFFKRLLFKNKEIKNLDFKVFRKRGKISSVLEKSGLKKNVQQGYSEAILGIVKVLKGEPDLTDLKQLEERFTLPMSKSGFIGGRRGEEDKIVVPSEYEDVNILYLETVKRIALASSEKDQKEYIRKLYDLLYYDFNQYIKDNQGKDVIEILESTDMLKEQSERINSNTGLVDVKGLLEDDCSGDAAKEKTSQKKNDAEVEQYQSPTKPFFDGGTEVFLWKDLIEEKGFSSWLKKKRSDSKVNNLYHSKPKNVEFIKDFMSLFEKGGEFLDDLVVEEYALAVKKTLGRGLYGAMVSALGVPKSSQDALRFNESLMKVAYLEECVSEEVKPLASHVEKMKRAKSEISAILGTLSSTKDAKERERLHGILDKKMTTLDGALRGVLGSEYTAKRTRAAVSRHSSGVKSAGLPNISRLIQRDGLVSSKSVLSDISEVKDTLDYFPKISTDIENLNRLSKPQGKKSKIVIEKKELLSKLISNTERNEVSKENRDINKKVQKNYQKLRLEPEDE